MNIFAWFKDAPVKRKLMLIGLLTSALALLSISIILAARGWVDWRARTVSDMTTFAEVIGTNATSALLFDDRKSAFDTLSALSANQDIVDAVIYDKAGKEFARFIVPQHSLNSPMPSLKPGSHLFSFGQLVVSEPIRFKGEVLGSVYLESDLHGLYAGLLRDIGLIFLVALSVFVASVLLFARMQKIIVNPILELVNGMLKVSGKQDYAVRVAVHSKDEVGMLAKTFNDMLEGIQARDAELAQHRRRLEGEVTQRTAALGEANQQLKKELVEHRQAEQALHDSEERFRKAFQYSAIGMALVGLDGRWLKVNDSLCQIVGYSEQELLSKTFQDITYPDDIQTDLDFVMQLLAGKIDHYQMEKRYIHKDGHAVWIRLSVSLIRDAKNSPIHFVSQIDDISARKQSEIELRSRTAFFEALVNTSADGIIVVDTEGRKVLQNRRTIDLWKIPEEVAADPDDSRQVQLVMSQTVDPKQFTDRVVYLYAHPEEISQDVIALKNGTILERYSAPVCDSNGHSYGRIWSFRDITERKRAEDKIRESEARYRGIFEYADDIIYLLAPDGTFSSLSPSFERRTGWKPQEWLGKSFASIIHPDDLPHAIEVFQAALSGKSTPTFELRIAKKSGEYFDSELSIVPVDPRGEIAAIGIARDVTARKQVEDQIRQLNEVLEAKVEQRTRQLIEAQEELVRKEKLAVLGQVAGSVGHELRNPLGVMSNAVYFLQTVLPDANESVKEYLNIIKSEIAGSERIVSDLLDSVRTKQPHAETVGVRELLAQTLRKLSIPAAIEVKLEVPATLPSLQVDPLQIHQVFRNLISNAMEAMPEGGSLEIRAVADEVTKNVVVSVRDSGIGMTSEQLGKLFQPLFTTKARGIGLGLVVVKNLTEANGGRVEVSSEAGKGSVFSVILPADQSKGK